MTNSLAGARRKARHYAMQALYQWQMAGTDAATIEAEFRADNDMSKVDVDYFHALVSGAIRQIEELDALFMPYLDRKHNELDAVSEALLRMGTFELLSKLDVPYRVVINEVVALAKKFGPTDSHKYLNGVLDKLALDLRQAEVADFRNKA
ncbi:MAG: transcription antitermination factor NusB [Pseudomonadales bacterium]|nr:transcription antitermination factor NusB [Pseudomonadales bacterium]